MFLPQLVYRWREWERGTMGRRRGASVLYVQREFEHVFHLNICTWNSNVANLHKMFSTTITVKNFISFSCYVHRKWDFFFLKILFFSNFQIWFVHFLSFFFYCIKRRCNRYLAFKTILKSSKTGQYVVFELKFDIRENELRIECKI